MLPVYRRNDWGRYNKRIDMSDVSNSLMPTNNMCNFGYIKKSAPKYKSIDEHQPDDIGGSGILDTIREKLKKLPKYAGKVADIYSSETGTALRNLIPSSDENARPGFAGEKHAVLELPNGKNGVANYMGPGTQIIKRLKRGDVGRTKSDTVSKMHDISYTLAHGAKNKSEQLKQIREADNRMIASLQKIRENKTDSNRNIQLGMRLIQAKKLGEDIGILDKSKFSGDIGTLNPSDKILLEKERNKLEQNGYGLDGKILPGYKLKMQLLGSKLKGPRKPRTDPSMDGYGAGSYPSASKGLTGQTKGHVLRGKPIEGKGAKKIDTQLKRLHGNGLGVAGKGKSIINNVSDILLSQGIPTALKGIKLNNVPQSILNSIVSNGLDGAKNAADIKTKVKEIGKKLVPIFMSYKMKQANLNPTMLAQKGIIQKALKGNGLKIAGQGGRGVMDSLADLMGNARYATEAAIGNALWAAVKGLFNLNKKMTGKGMSEWDKFWKGFSDGFFGTLDILGPIVSIFLPEAAPFLAIGKKLGDEIRGK